MNNPICIYLLGYFIMMYLILIDMIIRDAPDDEFRYNLYHAHIVSIVSWLGIVFIISAKMYEIYEKTNKNTN